MGDPLEHPPPFDGSPREASPTLLPRRTTNHSACSTHNWKRPNPNPGPVGASDPSFSRETFDRWKADRALLRNPSRTVYRGQSKERRLTAPPRIGRHPR